MFRGEGRCKQPKGIGLRPSAVRSTMPSFWRPFSNGGGLAVCLTSDLVVVDLGAGEGARREGTARTCVGDIGTNGLTPEEDVASLVRWLRPCKSKGRWFGVGHVARARCPQRDHIGWDVETWEGCPHTLTGPKKRMEGRWVSMRPFNPSVATSGPLSKTCGAGRSCGTWCTSTVCTRNTPRCID